MRVRLVENIYFVEIYLFYILVNNKKIEKSDNNTKNSKNLRNIWNDGKQLCNSVASETDWIRVRGTIINETHSFGFRKQLDVENIKKHSMMWNNTFNVSLHPSSIVDTNIHNMNPLK